MIYTLNNILVQKTEGDIGKHFYLLRFYNECSTNNCLFIVSTILVIWCMGILTLHNIRTGLEEDGQHPLSTIQYHYKRRKGYIGERTEDLRTTCVGKCKIKIRGAITRKDKVYIEIGHVLSQGNLWFMELMLKPNKIVDYLI